MKLNCRDLIRLQLSRLPLDASDYSVKIINPKNSGGNTVESWQSEVFSSVEQMNHVLGEEFADLIQGNNFEFGYMVPGHGMRGKQRPIENLDDLTMMWSEFKEKKCILLWIKCLKPNTVKRS